VQALETNYVIIIFGIRNSFTFKLSFLPFHFKSVCHLTNFVCLFVSEFLQKCFWLKSFIHLFKRHFLEIFYFENLFEKAYDLLLVLLLNVVILCVFHGTNYYSLISILLSKLPELSFLDLIFLLLCFFYFLIFGHCFFVLVLFVFIGSERQSYECNEETESQPCFVEINFIRSPKFQTDVHP